MRVGSIVGGKALPASFDHLGRVSVRGFGYICETSHLQSFQYAGNHFRGRLPDNREWRVSNLNDWKHMLRVATRPLKSTNALRAARFVAAMAFATNAMQVHASQGDKEVWSTVGVWRVQMDAPENGGCYMERTLEDGTVFRLGLKVISHEGYFAVFNADWKKLAESEVGEIYFDFGDEVFGGDAIGIVEGELRGGIADFNNPDFLTQLANRVTVVVSGSARSGFEFTLSGTKRAIEETDRCRVSLRSR